MADCHLKYYVYMGINTVFAALGLALLCLILLEGFTAMNLAISVAAGIISMVMYRRLLPLPPSSKGINLLKFALYPFYLVGQVYLSAFSAVKLIFTKADVAIITVKTELTNSLLRTILANSITLTPGSVSLELNDDTITLLWLKNKKDSPQDAQKAGETIKRKLEKMLLKAEKRGD